MAVEFSGARVSFTVDGVVEDAKSCTSGSSSPMQSPVWGYLLQLKRQETSKLSGIFLQTSSTLRHSELHGGLRRAGVGSHFGNTDRHTNNCAYCEQSSAVPPKNRR